MGARPQPSADGFARAGAAVTVAAMRRRITPSSLLVSSPLRLSDAVEAGASRDALKRDVDAGRLVRVHRGVYAPAPPTDDLDRLRVAALHLGPEAVAVIGSAVCVHGIEGLPTGRIPQLALPPGLERRQRAGIDLHVWDISPRELTVVDGMRVTTVPRTIADACRLLPRMLAVACVDSALHLGALTPADLEEVRGLMARRRNCVAGRRHLALAREGAQSPLETRVRLRAGDGGLPPDALQVPVMSPVGVLLGFADAGYALPDGGWLLVEADGRSVHELPEAVLHDRHRQNAFLSVPGVRMIRFAWPDTMGAEIIPGVLRPLLQAAGWRPGRHRS